MRYKVIVYYDNMYDSEHVFSNKNDCEGVEVKEVE